MDEIRLSALAMFLPAISKPVPWSGEVLIKSIPNVIFTPLKKSSVFIGMSAWSWYIQIATSYCFLKLGVNAEPTDVGNEFMKFVRDSNTSTRDSINAKLRMMDSLKEQNK